MHYSNRGYCYITFRSWAWSIKVTGNDQVYQETSLLFFYRHCGSVIFRDESTAEAVARRADGTVIHGGAIKARGPAEQRRRGHSGTYDGKIGYVPTIDNDKRPFTDCIHYVTGVCTNGFSVRHIIASGIVFTGRDFFAVSLSAQCRCPQSTRPDMPSMEQQWWVW